MQRLVRDCNALYRAHPALHSRDFTPDGFSWVDYNDREQSVLSFLRIGDDGERILAVVNATPMVRTGYRIGAPAGGFYQELLNTDAALYGGSNVGNLGGVWAADIPTHGRPCSLSLSLPPLAVLWFGVPA
jgi:1,4-alpha-glucan branching enzyme